MFFICRVISRDHVIIVPLESAGDDHLSQGTTLTSHHQTSRDHVIEESWDFMCSK